jgi:site-specific DNA-methyltransferase (adenine-specific)
MPPWPEKNLLCFGDNLAFLKEFADESVDLVYLDPPFNSQQSYNVLFKETSGAPEAAQIKAFEDTWTWDLEANKALTEIQRSPEVPAPLVELTRTFMDFLKPSPMSAYLVQMAVRLVQMHRVLKPTGSLYLHCDPTASHYLKLVLDAIFGPTNFRNEIVWNRTLSKGLMSRRLPANHDLILCYQKSDDATWNEDAMFIAYDEENLDPKTEGKYSHRDPDGRIYRLDNLINPNTDRPNLTYEFLGIKRVWRWTKERMQAAYEAGLVVQTKPGTVPQYKRYLDEQRGKPLGDIWNDIPPINSQAAERMGYPTQKPLELLKRSAVAEPRSMPLRP